MSRQATKACGNRYYEARMRAAKYNEKLLTRAGAIDYLPGVTEDSLRSKPALLLCKTSTAYSCKRTKRRV